MTILVDLAAITASFVTGVLAGHRIVVVAKAELAKLHVKLDAMHGKADTLIDKRVNTSRPLGK